MKGSLSTVATYLDGLVAALNTLPGTALVVDGVDCAQGRRGRVGVGHDLQSDLNRTGCYSRLQFTRLKYRDFTMGTWPKVELTLRNVHARLTPDAIFITGSTAVQLTGEYHANGLQVLSQEIGIPLIPFSSNALSGEFLDGFSDFLMAAAEAVPLEPGPRKPLSVGVVGMPCTRMEADCTANLAEIERLLSQCGIAPLAVLPSGKPLSILSALSKAETLVSLPYGAEAAHRLAKRTGAGVLTLPLPVGLGGTSAWLRELGRAIGVERATERTIERELQRCGHILNAEVRSAFAGTGVLLAADPYLAVALASSLVELGFELRGIALQTRDNRRASAATQSLAKLGINAPVRWDQDMRELRKAWELEAKAGASVVVGSSNERAAAQHLGIPYIEIGYPSLISHALFDAPWMGFDGTLWLANRIYNVLSEHRCCPELKISVEPR